MRIAEVIGTVTLSRCHPTLTGKRWLIGVPHSFAALQVQEGGDREDLVILDELGPGRDTLIAFSEGAEAAAPFFPEKKPVDAYCCCILDTITIQTKENF